MKIIAVAALAAALVLPGAPARAEEKSSGFGGFFKNLRAALEKSAVAGERKKARGAAVAAVRGSSQKNELADPNEPTLKGDSRSRRMAKKAQEDAELLKAVELADAGKNAEALAAFEAFQKAYPKSHKEDVETAIAKLKASPADAPAAPAAPAEGEAAKTDAAKAQ